MNQNVCGMKIIDVFYDNVVTPLVVIHFSRW